MRRRCPAQAGVSRNTTTVPYHGPTSTFNPHGISSHHHAPLLCTSPPHGLIDDMADQTAQLHAFKLAASVRDIDTSIGTDSCRFYIQRCMSRTYSLLELPVTATDRRHQE